TLRGWEMSVRPCVYRWRADAGRLEPARVVVGGEIAGERADAPLSAERPRRGLEQRRLAGARRAHDVDRDERSLHEMMAVVRGAAHVFREDPLLHVERHHVGIAAAA